MVQNREREREREREGERGIRHFDEKMLKKHHFEDLGKYWRIILKKGSERSSLRGDSKYSQVASSCEEGNEPSPLLRSEQFLK